VNLVKIDKFLARNNIIFGKVIKVVWGTAFWNFVSHKAESSQT